MKRFLILIIILFAFNYAAFAAGTWVLQTSPTDEDLYGVFMTSQTTACAVGDNNLVMKTDDIGENWAIKATPSAGDHLKAVHFPSALVGYAVGETNITLKSIDGGDTWAPTTGSANLVKGPYDVFFTSDTTGYIIGSHVSNGCTQKTIDGGTSWVYNTPGLTSDFYAIYFTDSNNGWLVGDIGYIHHTPDGGTNWISQTSGVLDRLNDVFFIDSNTGWVVGINGVILKTTNGGTNWNTSNSGISGTPFLNAVHFVDSNRGWVVGNGGVIYTTIDGGANWVAEASGTSADLEDVYFYDEKNGYAVGAGGNILNNSVVPAFGVSPSSAPAGESLNIALTAASGSFFRSDVTVTVTGISGISYTFNRVSDTLIDVPIDLSDSGVLTITVTDGDARFGTGTFTVNPLPDISLISPSTVIQGSTGLTLTIHGSGFQNGVTFDFGSNIAVTSTTFDSAHQATVVVDIGSGAATGPQNVGVTNPDGGSFTAINIVTISAPVTPPTISSVSPNTVTQGDSLNMVVYGGNFQSGAVVTIANNGITINSTDYSNIPNQLGINISVGSTAALGSRTLIVTNPDAGSASLTNAFYVQSPTVVNPVINSLDRQIYIGWVDKNFAINGSNFQLGADLSFTPSTGIIVKDLQFISSTQLRGIISVNSSAQPGPVTLRLLNPDGGFDDFPFNLQTQTAKLEKGKKIYAFPNPVNARTAKSVDFQFDMSRDGPVTLPIFDKTGRKQAELVHNGTVGKNTATWNLRNFAGEIPANQMLLIYGIHSNEIFAKSKFVIVSH